MSFENKVKHDDVKNGMRSLVFVGISVLLQITWVVLMFIRLNEKSTLISLCMSITALIVVLALNGKHTNAAVKMPWTVLILSFPILGLPLYLMLGRSGSTRGMRKRFEDIDGKLLKKIPQDEEVFKTLEKTNIRVANISRYIKDYAKYPIYNDSEVEYYKEASDALEAQKKAIKKAKKFIFMEYHAIEEAESFLEIEKLLELKAKEGVEVRLFYDDVGSSVFIDKNFAKRMNEKGINCRIFNPMMPIVNVFMDNRDHRKITVIDGYIGFTGGYNLANEYFNVVNPYGYWKDTGVKITGNAVKNLTITFLEMWNAVNPHDKDDESFRKYLPDAKESAKKCLDYNDSELKEYKKLRDVDIADRGYVQPYADSPLDLEHVGENVYLSMIYNAKKYIYFMTPYLIITDDMNRAMGMAAKRGVDVRIITPGIPDKRVIYTLTRSYYPSLIRRGVKIYEYSPGFCHAKMCVSDDEIATVGTINLDYRSLYHHFENGVFMYNNKAVADIKQDFDDVFKECENVTEIFNEERNSIEKNIGYSIMRLFAPLL